VPGDTIAVLAPSVYVSITIETDASGDDIHLHAGGQGIWVARMLRLLEHQPVVCAPVGGETGKTLLGLTREWGIRLHAVATVATSPAYVHDRRGGERVELARSPAPQLHRHEVDHLYSQALELALASRLCVVTGPETPGLLEPEVYRRLGADLAAAGVQVVADMHGDELLALLDGGPVERLKVSLGDLVEDGIVEVQDGDEPTDAALVAAIDALVERGAHEVVVSRGDLSTVARTASGWYEVTGPTLAVVDATGSGDSMTAALAASLAEELDDEATLRRAWAAGAANVTRRGLGSAVPGLIAELAERVVVEPWETP
jgi:1-phosphofructokinase